MKLQGKTALMLAIGFASVGWVGAIESKDFSKSLDPIGFVLQEDDYHIWCNAPIYDDQGRVHLFVSRWPVKDSFGKGWHTSCEIAHYEAATPEGPYTYRGTVLKGDGKEGSWRKQGTHNVTCVRLPDKRYALLFIANSGDKGFPGNQKIGMMLSNSLEGPWRLAGKDGLILDIPTDPKVWSFESNVGVNNPTLLPLANGKFFLYYKAKRGKDVRRMGLAIADQVEGPYRFEEKPLTENKGTIEDGFAFVCGGKPSLLVTDCHTELYGGGMIYQSVDGITFSQEYDRAYEAITHYYEPWKDGSHAWSKWVLQRPALLVDQAGEPKYFFAPCGTTPSGKKGTSTFLFKIRPGEGAVMTGPKKEAPTVKSATNPGQFLDLSPKS